MREVSEEQLNILPKSDFSSDLTRVSSSCTQC